MSESTPEPSNDGATNVGPDDVQAVPTGENTSSGGETIEPEDADTAPARSRSPFADDEDDDPESLIGTEVTD